MRILLIAEASHAGVGKHVLDLSEGLSRKGHQVHLVYSPLRSDELFEKRLAAIPRGNFEATSLPMLRSPHPKDLGAAMRIRAIIRRHGPFDIVHGHSSKGGALARMAGLGTSKAVLYTPHAFITANPEIGRVSRAAYGLIEWGLSLFTTRIVAVSEDEKRHAGSIGISGKKVEVIENGIDLSACNRYPDRRSEFGIPKDALVIGSVGRLSAQKDPGNLLEAFASVAVRFPSAHLALVGEGPLRGELEARVRTLGLADRVHFLGLRNGADCMTSFDIFVLSSRYEGMPYVLIEAAASGLPIAATQVAGVGGLVKDGRNGFLVPPENASALGAALEKLLGSADLRKGFSEESRRLATGFSLEAMVDKTEALYRRLAGP